MKIIDNTKKNDQAEKLTYIGYLNVINELIETYLFKLMIFTLYVGKCAQCSNQNKITT